MAELYDCMMTLWTAVLVTAVLHSPGSGLDVADICARCSCQYLTSSHLTETVCTTDRPLLEVNCTTRPKVRQNSNQFLHAPTTSNGSVVVWLTYRHAGLTSLPVLAPFEPFNVTMLSLDHNRLVYLPPRGLSGLRNLSVLTATHNDISSLAPDSLKGLHHLKYVDLSFNSLHKLDFHWFVESALISLAVRNNSVQSVIIPGEFQMKTLEALDLSDNKLTDLPLMFYGSFPNLLNLNLSYNPLQRMTADLGDLGQLKVLDASGTQVKQLKRPEVERLKNLHRLYLGHNSLSDVDFVESLTSLNTLDVSFNSLSSLGDRHLSSSLQRLVVSHNNLTDLSHIFKVFDNLKSLDGGWNPCGEFPEHVRAGLRELILDGTLLSSWPAQRPGEGSIDHLSLSDIPAITALGPFAFSGILKHKNDSGKCTSLKISNTSLASIDEDAFRDLDICKLDLSHNRLRWLPESLLPWGSLVGVDLQGNPWHCDCALQWMLSTVVPAIYRSDQALLEDLRCASPPSLSDTRLVHWYNHQGAALCGPTKQDAMLAPKSRSLDASAGPLVTLSSSPLMIAVLLFLSVLAAMLVILGFALQRRATQRRRLRRNRRF